MNAGMTATSTNCTSIYPLASCSYLLTATQPNTIGTPISGTITVNANASGDNLSETLTATITPVLYAGTSTGVSLWDGSSWTAISGSPTSVKALTFDATGNLYAGTATGTNDVKEWNGSIWSNVGSVFTPTNVYALVFNPSNNYLYAGCHNLITGCRVRQWDGLTWSDTGTSIPTDVNTLAFDASGNLYAGSGSNGSNNVQELVAGGSGTWSAIGSITKINALIFDTNWSLYAGTNDDTSGVYELNILTSSWNPVNSSGIPPSVNALAFDKSGNLYAGIGPTGGATPISYVYKLTGGSWGALGALTLSVNSLVFDASGNLYAGTNASSPNNAVQEFLADPATISWNPVGASNTPSNVTALAISNQLYVQLP
jgi:ligand-binding sensor domain-containing protein